MKIVVNLQWSVDFESIIASYLNYHHDLITLSFSVSETLFTVYSGVQ